VLADGHRLRQVERARRLSEDAEALHRQAAHQLKRAKKNLRGCVLVVDDSDDFLRAAGAVVAGAAELRLVGSASSGEEALRLLPVLKPDLVVLDIHMPGMSGIETARIIRSTSPGTAIVFVSAAPAGYEEAAKSVGAAALIEKAELRPGMLDALWMK
jgi:CheY-like chemotaxis protein